MSALGCLFVVQAREPQARRGLEDAAGALAAWYGAGVAFRWLPELRVLVGSIAGDHGDLERHRLVWGTDPRRVPPARHLLRAGDAALRAIAGPALVVGWDEERLRIASGVDGLMSLYGAHAEGRRAWSTHAVAARALAGGAVDIDPTAVAQLLATDFVGGTRTVVRGAQALRPGTVVDLAPSGARCRQVLDDAERWEPREDRQAREEAPQALRASLHDRLDGADSILLGLTAGLDSLTAATVLCDLGIRFRAVTYGQEVAGELEGARRVAGELGVPHDALAIGWWGDQEGFERMDDEVRWHEAGAPVGFGGVRWSDRVTHWVPGIGAETGRSFYWRWVSPPAKRRPTAGTLRRALTTGWRSAVVGAEPARERELAAEWSDWLEQARTSGHAGWALLDVVYAQQRVTRWGRGMVPRLDAALVPAFTDWRLQRALASLPVQDRLTDRFQRDLLARLRPDLAPAPAPRPRSGPAPALRAATTLTARRVRRRVAAPPRFPPPERPWYRQPPWSERPALIDWLLSDVLTADLGREALGAGWLHELRSRALAGQADAAERARRLASCVVLERSLRVLARLVDGAQDQQRPVPSA